MCIECLFPQWYRPERKLAYLAPQTWLEISGIMSCLNWFRALHKAAYYVFIIRIIPNLGSEQYSCLSADPWGRHQTLLLCSHIAFTVSTTQCLSVSVYINFNVIKSCILLADIPGSESSNGCVFLWARSFSVMSVLKFFLSPGWYPTPSLATRHSKAVFYHDTSGHPTFATLKQANVSQPPQSVFNLQDNLSQSWEWD